MVTSSGSGTYLGREEQLDRLLARLEEARGGRGGWLVVHGPPGAGVSSTLDELAAHADQQGVDVLRGAGTPGIAGRPFGALADAIEARAAGADPVALYGELADAASTLARVAPGLRGALPAIPPPAPLEPIDETLRLWDAFSGWLRRASDRSPLLLALDDQQWSDDDLWSVLNHLAPTLAALPVLLLTGWSSAEPVSRSLPESVEVVTLPGLDDGAIGVLLARVSGEHVPRAVAQLVQQATDGQPLAALQLHRHLLEEELIGRPGRAALPGPGELPSTAGDAIAWRLARLSLEERTALGALACFPLAVGPAAVAAVSGLSRPRAADALERAVTQGFARSVEGSGRYALSHALVGATVRAGLSPSIRARALAEAAEALELELGPEARRHAALLLDLYRQAHAEPVSPRPIGGARAAVAARHGLVASENARAAAAYGRAAECLEMALELAVAGGHPMQHELRLRLAQALADARRPEAALVTASQVFRAELDRGATDVLLATIRSLFAQGAVQPARELHESLGRRLRGTDQLTAARLEMLTGAWQEVESGGVLRALAWQQTAVDGVKVLLAEGSEEDISGLFEPQRPRDQQQTVDLLGLARGWRQPSALLRALHGASVDLATRLGRFPEGLSWAGEYVAAADRFGSPRDQVRALALLAQCQSAVGQLDDAAESLLAARAVDERLPGDRRQSDEILLAELALAHYRDDDWPALARRAVEAAGSGSPAGMLFAGEAAVALARSGDTGRAEAYVQATLQACADWPPLTYLRDSALMSALSAAWECGWAQHVAAGHSLAQVSMAAGAGGSHAATPGLAIARMHALAGQLNDARRLFADQRASLAEAGMRPLRAIVDFDEAVCLAAAGPERFAEAGQLLELAARAFEQLGMTGWLDRVRQLLDGGLEAGSQPGGRLHFTYPRGLSRREADLVRLVSSGTPPEEAARLLELEPAVAQRHLDAALAKLEAGSLDELPRLARRLGLGGA